MKVVSNLNETQRKKFDEKHLLNFLKFYDLVKNDLMEINQISMMMMNPMNNNMGFVNS